MKNRLVFAMLVLLSGWMVSCQPKQKTEPTNSLPKFITWDGEGSFNHNMTDAEIEAYLQRLKDNHIGALFLNASNDFYKRTGPLAQKIGIQLHAWRPTMIRGGKEFMEEHKDWYAVSGKNESVLDNPPYVDYYRWLCPTEPQVMDYLMNDYLELAKIEGVSGIHFDYIRYCDVYLPVGLLPKYNLVQDHEMPEFDFCYCHRCREAFKKEYGRDPLEIEDPASDVEWRNWRLQQIVKIVNTIGPEVKKQTGKMVTAAVFPTPEMSARMVRQDWGKFEIDAAFPMLYNGFYNEDIDWIGKCVKEGLETMEVKKPIYAGVFVSDLKEPEKFRAAIKSALDNGASGVVFFNAQGLNDELFSVIKEFSEE